MDDSLNEKNQSQNIDESDDDLEEDGEYLKAEKVISAILRRLTLDNNENYSCIFKL